MFPHDPVHSLVLLTAGAPHHPHHAPLPQLERPVLSPALLASAVLQLVEDGVEHQTEVPVHLLRSPVPRHQVEDLLGVEELRHRNDVPLETVQLEVGGGQVDQTLLC